MDEKGWALDGVVVLTGVTGGLGSELLPRLARRYPERRIVALIRGGDSGEVAARLDAALAYGGLTAEERLRVDAVRGDIGQPRFGLDERGWQALASHTTRVFHLAASVDFDLPLAESRAANVDGTREVLRFARECMRHGTPGFRLNHVSTAYVAGRRQGRLGEDELHCGQDFWNAYEQSKFEAEAMVAALDLVPATIYRPSQIIGESQAGRIRKFFGYYEFLKLAERGKMPVLLADAVARPDLVPTDYVCDAMLHLGERSETLGRTYHLTAGLRHSLSFERIFRLMYDAAAGNLAVDRSQRLPRMFRSELLEAQATPQELRHYHLSPLKLLLRTYWPYLDYERDFDCSATHGVLAAAGIELPSIERTLRLTTQYAIDVRYMDAALSGWPQPRVCRHDGGWDNPQPLQEQTR